MIQIWSFCAGRKTSRGGYFAYVCTEKLAFVDYMRKAQKIHCYRIGVCAYIRGRLHAIWNIFAHAKLELLRPSVRGITCISYNIYISLEKVKIVSFQPSRKRLRAKNTPDLHLTYSNTRGSVGL